MLFLTAIRHEVARTLLARAGRAVALDRIPVHRRRSRRQHLRNAAGAIAEAGSQLAWRPTPFVSFYYLTRAGVHSELGYGLDELGRALRPPESARGRALLATLAGVATLLVVSARASRRAPAQPPLDEPAGDASTVPPVPAVVGS